MNVLLYVLDALRADHLSCYGYERETTPIIDRLANEGVRFDRCYAPATWTRPVAASLLTGLYPPAHGTRTRYDTLGTAHQTLATQLHDAGYDTVGVTSMGNVSTATGFNRGFDRFYDLYLDESLLDRRASSTATEEELKTETGAVALPRAEDITATLKEWLTGRESEAPFFAFCWSIETHIPYDPPPDSMRFRDPDYDGPVDGSRESLMQVRTPADLNQLQALYDEEIRYNDDCIGDVLALLESRDELDETLVVVVGDHGDAFCEHGRLTHGHAPHEEVVRVPWVLRPPAGDSSTGFVDSQVSLVDVAPTLIELATGRTTSESVGGNEEVGGTSLAGAMSGETVTGKEAVFFETRSYDMQNGYYGVRTPEWKYVEIDRPDLSISTLVGLVRYIVEKGILTDVLRNPRYYVRRYRHDEKTQLYRLATDPDERENVADSYTDQRAALATVLSEWRHRCERFRSALPDEDTQADVDEKTREQLHQLGYVE